MVNVCEHHVQVFSPRPEYVTVPSLQIIRLIVNEKSKQSEFAGAVNPDPGGVTDGGAENVADNSTVRDVGNGLTAPSAGHGRLLQHPSTPQQHFLCSIFPNGPPISNFRNQ
jgi:hypothetical protein